MVAYSLDTLRGTKMPKSPPTQGDGYNAAAEKKNLPPVGKLLAYTRSIKTQFAVPDSNNFVDTVALSPGAAVCLIGYSLSNTHAILLDLKTLRVFWCITGGSTWFRADGYSI